MSKMTSQDYAALSQAAYNLPKNGAHGDSKVRPYNPCDVLTISGSEYRVIGSADNQRTGYQGTIFQRVDDGNIIVAHRGTEQIIKDGVITDGGMVLSRVNIQAEDAIKLTQQALRHANNVNYDKPKEVTVTGHSLGGTLAQITAHHFDLRGETFNAYGAASLGLRIPSGSNDRVVNHVIATDPVAAASPHYGEVKIYARDKDIRILDGSGYANNRFLDALSPDLPMVAAARSLGAHGISNFVSPDKYEVKSPSILNDKSAIDLAVANERMIADYRGDVRELRAALTIGSRLPYSVADLLNHARGPIPAGEPAAKDEKFHGEQHFSEQLPTSSPKGASLDWGPRDAYVARLLTAAGRGNPDEICTAISNLQQSAYGGGWQQSVDLAAQQLNQQNSQQHEVMRQSVSPQHEAAAISR